MPKVPELKILYRGNGADLAVDDVTADLVMCLPSDRWKRNGSKSWSLPGLRSARISFIRHFGKEAAAFMRRMVKGKRVRLDFDPATHHGLTKTARNRGERWIRVP